MTVTSKTKHSKLKKACGVTLEVPLLAEEQWAIFVEIAKHANSPWRSEVLFFSQKLIRRLKDTGFGDIANSLQNIRRSSYNIWHNATLPWDASFNSIEDAKRLSHYSSYAISTVRQLYLIAANSATGFRPAINEDSAPIKLLQDAYAYEYGLNDDNHNSTIIETTSYNFENKNPVYYSVNFPTLARRNISTFKGKSLITLVDDVERIINACQEHIPLLLPRVKSLYDVSIATKFSFYHSHSEKEIFKNILGSEFVAQEDERFTQNQQGRFAAHSQFFKGCIKIEPK